MNGRIVHKLCVGENRGTEILEDEFQEFFPYTFNTYFFYFHSLTTLVKDLRYAFCLLTTL